MARNSIFYKISVLLSVIFAMWIVWLWVKPVEIEKQTKKPETIEKAAVEQKIEQADAPSILVLPTPPAPKKMVQNMSSKSVKKGVNEQPKEIVKAVEEKPKEISKPISKPKAAQKVEATKKTEPIKELEISPVHVANGRALLRVLEHGKGPLIEIAWPKSNQARAALYRQFMNCYGMENALMDEAGDLYRDVETKGRRWEINLDRYSGFLRQASGVLVSDERKQMNKIGRHHRNLLGPVPVRIFPRRVDASLLGGLREVIGKDYMQAKSIHARYQLARGRVSIGEIEVDGRSFKDVIALSRMRSCERRV